MKTRDHSTRATEGFTLLEVMVSIAILAISLSAVFSTEAGAIRMAARSRKMGNATLLARCKMGEIEEKIAKEGLPAVFASGADKCCTDAEIEGFDCKWEIEPILMPDTMFNPQDNAANAKPGANGTATSSSNGSTNSSSTTGSSTTNGSSPNVGAAQSALSGAALGPTPSGVSATALAAGALGGSAMPGQQAIAGGAAAQALIDDPSKVMSGGADVGGIASMAMALVYPMLKPSFEGQIRRATVTITWHEGGATRSFDVTQYLVAETPVVPGVQDAVDGTGAPGGIPGAAPGGAAPAAPGGGLFGGLIGGGAR